MSRGGLVLVLMALLAPAAKADERSERVRRDIRDLRSRDVDVRRRAASDLRKMGAAAAPASEALARALGDVDWDVRDDAGDALERIGSLALPAYLKVIRKESAWTRRRIAERIAKVRTIPPEHLRDLVALLDDPEAAAVGEAVAQAGAAAVPDLMAALGGRSPEARDAAATVLARIGIPAAPPLTEALSARSASLRASAATALGRMGSATQSAVQSLILLLQDADAEVRARAAEALGRLGRLPDSVVPALVAVLADPEEAVRASARAALVRFGKQAVPALVAAIEDGPEAVAALAAIGDDAVSELEAVLRSEDAGVRARAARAFAAMHASVDVPERALADLLSDADVEVRRGAAAALAAQGRECRGVAKDLTRARKDTDAEVRASLVAALAAAGEGVAFGLDDADARVRVAAAIVQARKGEPAEALAMLRSCLADAPAEAARGLGLLGREAADAMPELLSRLGHEQPAVRAAAAEALGRVASTSGAGVTGRRERYAKAPARVRESVEKGLQWLARFQDASTSSIDSPDGRWHPVNFTKHDPSRTMDGPGGALYSVGVTGLAVQAFLAAGYTDGGDDNPYALHVREGLRFLVKSVDVDGCLGTKESQHFMLNHGFGTVALCEALILTGDPAYGRAAQRALDFCAWARNPYLAWRYEPRGGENDTDITSVMAMALRLGDLAGLDVDRAAYAGAASWVEQMTDPGGKTGYNMPGGYCARPEGLQELFPCEKVEPMTAAGLWARILIGGRLRDAPEFGNGLRRCHALPPVWSRAGTIDLYYWYFGSLALYHGDPKLWRDWEAKLEEALLPAQRPEPDGAFTGSWDPVDPWSLDGGRIYSTAMALLALLTPYRYERDFLGARLPPSCGEAVAALKKAARDDDPSVRQAAEAALDRILRR